MRSRTMEMSGFTALVLLMAFVVILTIFYVASGNGD
jgi:hypothetical protein